MTPARLSLKVAYTVPELSEMLGWSRWAVLRMLRRLRIYRQPGGKGTRGHVYLTDLKRLHPDLWESLLERESILG